MLTQLIIFLNSLANAIGRVLLAPVAAMPGWLSATIIGAITGVLMLIAFKHTSNQKAVKHARDQIKAHMLALSLFKDNIVVCLKAQGVILWNAAKLLVLAIVPMLAMLIPMVLVLGQLSLWYQARPLRVGEEAVVTVQLAKEETGEFPAVSLEAAPAFENAIGPHRILSERAVCWNIVGKEPGYHALKFRVGDQQIEKELAVGDGLMRVSLERPDWDWSKALLSPWEQPFPKDSTVQSISIAYPKRASWTSGTDYWVIYWFAISMLAALAVKKPLNVNL